MGIVLFLNPSNFIPLSFPYTFPIDFVERNALGAKVAVIGTTSTRIEAISPRESTRSFPYAFPINLSGSVPGTISSEGNAKVVFL